jgi:hypothetical protein
MAPEIAAFTDQAVGVTNVLKPKRIGLAHDVPPFDGTVAKWGGSYSRRFTGVKARLRDADLSGEKIERCVARARDTWTCSPTGGRGTFTQIMDGADYHVAP